jgi:NAD(P)H-hydrate epimerase
VLCGAGNNAGDGYVVARLARAVGLDVTVAALSDPATLSGDAARAWREFRAEGGSVVPWTPGLCENAELAIDALLGTGIARPLEGAYLRAVEALNASALPVVAVDVPSGLDGESGRVMGAAVEADVTATFIARKQGLYLADGPAHCGRVLFSDLGVPLGRAVRAEPQMRLFDAAALAASLPRRSRVAHKGDFGHVLVIGGNHGMGGAARLAGEAALRAGAGLVTVATRPENVAAVTGYRPELMCIGTAEAADLDVALERATVIAIGPGLGRDVWARELLGAALDAVQPLVVDADALNLLAERPARRDHWILTPHPGVAVRLLGTTGPAIQAERLRAVRDIAAKFGGACILKGRCTLVARDGELPYVIDAGNPGMASAGMGDVLTGITAGLLAQDRDGALLRTAACAAYVHASAGDAAAAKGERGLVAGDLLAELRAWLNPSS